MYKVKIIDNGGDFKIITKMPKIPSKGDLLGCYICNVWFSGEVECIFYSLQQNGKFDIVEIYVDLEE